MSSSVLVDSLGIGAIVFIVLLMVWFVAAYLKRRVGLEPYQDGTAFETAVSWEEKRKQPRVAVSWQATMDSGRGPEPVQLRDISLGGAFLVCLSPLPLKARLVVTLESPSGPLTLNAEVVWSNTSVISEKIINRGMGIRFIDNPQDARDRLSRSIAACFDNRP
jgi:hypothetical protein